MRTSTLALLAGVVSAQETVNRTLTNGWGSVPQQRHYINATQAWTAIDAAVQQSMAIGYVCVRSSNSSAPANLHSVPNNIAIVDPSAQLVAFLRMDNAFLASVDISIKKAKTVALFNGLFPSYGFYNRSQPGAGNDLFGIEETNDGLVVFGGGATHHRCRWIFHWSGRRQRWDCRSRRECLSDSGRGDWYDGAVVMPGKPHTGYGNAKRRSTNVSSTNESDTL